MSPREENASDTSKGGIDTGANSSGQIEKPIDSDQLFNPTVMRRRPYDNFGKYSETYVPAPDTYGRPQTSAEEVAKVVARVLDLGADIFEDSANEHQNGAAE